MKLSKFVKRAKSESYCVVIHADDSGIWLGTRLALYNATELPYMEGKEQAGAVLDIDSKAWEKMFFDEKYTAHAGADFGMNLTETDPTEQEARRVPAGNVLQGYGAGWPYVRQWWGADFLRFRAASPPLPMWSRTATTYRPLCARPLAVRRMWLSKTGLKCWPGLCH